MRGMDGGPARAALGAVGTVDVATLGDTLNDCLRGPEGAVGGGVPERADAVD